jgi:hypothetical protein
MPMMPLGQNITEKRAAGAVERRERLKNSNRQTSSKARSAPVFVIRNRKKKIEKTKDKRGRSSMREDKTTKQRKVHLTVENTKTEKPLFLFFVQRCGLRCCREGRAQPQRKK